MVESDILISIIYNGRLGNNLFQYCYGRIIANKLGIKLKADKINGFEHTGDNISGVEIYPPIIFSGFFCDYSYYKKYKNDIKKWLFINKKIEENINKDDLVVYIRRSDYVSSNFSMPMSFYDNCVKDIPHNKLYVCTCDPNDPDIKDFVKKHNAILRHKSVIDDFKFLMNFNKIVLSQSTYCWWAAWLSDATEIYCPLSENFGAWANKEIYSLIVDDEPRYKYITVTNPYKYSFKFFIYIYLNAIIRRIKGWDYENI